VVAVEKEKEEGDYKTVAETDTNYDGAKGVVQQGNPKARSKSGPADHHTGY